MSGLTEAQVLHVSVQKEFSERQSDRQEIDLLRWDAWERCRQTGTEALPRGSQWATRGVGVGKARLFLSGSGSSLVSGKVCIQIRRRVVLKLLPSV